VQCKLKSDASDLQHCEEGDTAFFFATVSPFQYQKQQQQQQQQQPQLID